MIKKRPLRPIAHLGFLFLLLLLPILATGQTNAWINEFHYDNDGSDTDEGVEIVVESVDDIANYSIVLYNGSNGTSYTGAGALTLTHTEGDFTIYTADASGMQNGAPDGVALVYNGTAIQFLSYEGSFTATNGPANGMTSTDVGVAEVSTTTVGYSLQLSGTGTTYTDFTWEEAATSTFGAVNTGQAFGEAPNTAPAITAITTTPASPTDADAVSISATITDDDAVSTATLYWDTTSGDLVISGTAITMTASGNTYTTASSIPAQADGTTVYYQIVATDNEATTPLTTTSAEQSYTVAEPLAINAWINEFHYDNDGSDTDEGVEIVIENVDDIANYSIVLYNGSNGTSYTGAGALTLTHTEGDFTIYTADASGMQNGAPDGVALVYNGTAIQFLSYEGSFAATNGPANGMTSTDVGVAEVSTTTVGYSLQLSGTGTTYTDFTWEEAATSTFGAVNTGQAFGEAPNTAPAITAITTTPASPTDADAVSISATITDDDAVATATLYWDTTSGNLVGSGTAVTMTASGNTYTTVSNIPAQPNGTTVYYQIVAIDNDATTPLTTTSTEASYTVNASAMVNAWINEIHYDNAGTDVNEGVELVVENIDDISKYSIVLYNGSNGENYKTIDGADLISGDVIGDFSIYYILYETADNIQNGNPDGLTLLYESTVVQFLSYEGEGVFTALDGPANGLTSIDIGVSEPSSSPVGSSLQLTGSGYQYSDFTWEAPATETFGHPNNGQAFAGIDGTYFSDVVQTPVAPTPTETVSISVTATDTDGLDTGSVILHWGTASDALTNSINMTASGDTYAANTAIPVQATGTTIYYSFTALDNMGDSSTSALFSYVVNDTKEGDVIITEIMYDPEAVDDTKGEYFEIYNTTNRTIDLEGWTIKDAEDNEFVIAGSLEILPSGFLVLGKNADEATNGGVVVDYEYSGMTLTNDEDAIILINTYGTIIDEVDYNVDWVNIPDFATLITEVGAQNGINLGEIKIGNSMVFVGFADEDNNDGALWETSTGFIKDPEYTGSFTVYDFGSPGSIGDESPIGKTVYTYDAGWDTTPGGDLGANSYILIKNGNVDLGGITVETIQNRAGTITASGDLTLTEQFFNNGTADLSASTLTLAGDSPQLISGNGFTVNNLALDSGMPLFGILNNIGAALINVSEDNPITILNSVDVNDDYLAVNENTLTFKSTATTNAIVYPNTEGAIVGTVISEHYYQARRAFRFIASPVTSYNSINTNWKEGGNGQHVTTPTGYTNPKPGYGTHITGTQNEGGANGLDYTPSGNPSLFTMNNETQDWESVLNILENEDPSVPELVAGDAYRIMVRGDRSVDVTNNDTPPTPTTLRTHGSLLFDDYNVPDMASAAGAFTFYGNPYQAPVNMTAVMDDSETAGILASQYYLWDPHLGERGSYISVDIESGGVTQLPQEVSGASTASAILRVGTSAFVKNDETAGSRSLVIKPSHQVADTGSSSEARSYDGTPYPEIGLILYEAKAYTAGGSFVDASAIRFKNSYDTALTESDIYKIWNLDESLGIILDDQLLSVDKRNYPKEKDTIGLLMYRYRSTAYVLRIDLVELDDMRVALHDKYTNAFYEFSGDEITYTFPFTVDEAETGSVAYDRFELIIGYENLSANNVAQDDFHIFPNPVTTGNLFLKLPQAMLGENLIYTIYNLLGQKVQQATLLATKEVVTVQLNTLESGLYILNIQGKNGNTHTQQLLIK